MEASNVLRTHCRRHKGIKRLRLVELSSVGADRVAQFNLNTGQDGSAVSHSRCALEAL